MKGNLQTKTINDNYKFCYDSTCYKFDSNIYNCYLVIRCYQIVIFLSKKYLQSVLDFSLLLLRYHKKICICSVQWKKTWRHEWRVFINTTLNIYNLFYDWGVANYN